jgi:hypothetical protein
LTQFLSEVVQVQFLPATRVVFFLLRGFRSHGINASLEM